MTAGAPARPEPRACSNCGYKVVSPYVKRCPRCLSALAVAAADVCGGCAQGCATTVPCADGDYSKPGPVAGGGKN